MRDILESIMDVKPPQRKKNALLITLPSSIKWEDYEKELKAVEDESQVMNFKVPFLPKNIQRIKRVYLIYQGNIVGWQKFVGTSDKPFKCTTTDKNWDGNFLQRTGPFHKIDPIPCKGFQGFRYFDFEK